MFSACVFRHVIRVLSLQTSCVVVLIQLWVESLVDWFAFAPVKL